MKKTLTVLATLVVALIAMPSVAQAAETYPDPTVSIVIDPAACVGDPLPAKAAASVSGQWTLTYLGQTRTGSGKSVAANFSTENAVIGKGAKFTATLVYDGGKTLSRSANIVLPECSALGPAGAGLGNGGSGGNGILPDTGGAAWWLLPAGALLLAGGAVALKRRAA